MALIEQRGDHIGYLALLKPFHVFVLAAFAGAVVVGIVMDVTILLFFGLNLSRYGAAAGLAMHEATISMWYPGIFNFLFAMSLDHILNLTEQFVGNKLLVLMGVDRACFLVDDFADVKSVLEHATDIGPTPTDHLNFIQNSQNTGYTARRLF